MAGAGSFFIAVLAIWALNRRRTFAGRGLQRRPLEALPYLSTQVGGAAINLWVFGVCLRNFPLLARIPVLGLGVGAVGGFALNFLLSNAVLYSRSRVTTSG